MLTFLQHFSLLVPTIITSFPNYTRLFPRLSVSIQIEYIGNPNVTLYWYRNGVPIAQCSSGNSSTLTITSSSRERLDRYVANASNSNGVTLQEFVIECK